MCVILIDGEILTKFVKMGKSANLTNKQSLIWSFYKLIESASSPVYPNNEQKPAQNLVYPRTCKTEDNK